MRRFFTPNRTFIAATVAALLTATSAGPVLAQDDKLATDEAKASYGLGMMIGEQLKEFGEVDFDLLMEAIQAQNSDSETLLSMEEAQAALQARAQAAAEEAAMKASEAGSTFLAENEARDEVTVTESGLQWEVLTEGDGDKPTADSTVSVHYVGTLIDGTEFDSSISRGEPATFPLTGVIPGWTEGLQLMSVGSKYRFVIPSDLEVELLEIM